MYVRLQNIIQRQSIDFFLKKLTRYLVEKCNNLTLYPEKNKKVFHNMFSSSCV